MEGKTILGFLLATVMSAGLLAIAEPAQAAFPGKNGKIAFVRYRDRASDGDIYAMNPDGTGLSRLTNGPAYENDPAWSPDGARIAYRSDDDIFVMNADGSKQARLTSGPGQDANPAWSPDGKKIAFVRYEEGADSEIYAMNADGSGLRKLTDDAVNDGLPSWSPDGSKIAYASSDNGKPGIFTMNPDATGKTRLTTTWEKSTASDDAPSWSPDGKKIVFERNAYRTNGEIHVVNPDGSEDTKLASNTYYNASPRWSPDGAKIAYAGPSSGPYYGPYGNNYEIYTMNADGTGQANITNNSSVDLSPDWGVVPTVSQANPPNEAKDTGTVKNKDKTKGRAQRGGR